MDWTRLSQLADELQAIQPRLIEEGLLLSTNRLIGTTEPFATAARMIAGIIEAGGLQGPKFASFRVAVRVVVESSKPQWLDILHAGLQTLPVQEIAGKKDQISVAAFVVEQVRRELYSGSGTAGDQGESGAPPKNQDGIGNVPTPAGSARLSPSDLAQRYGVNAEALRKRLDRWRYVHDAGYAEVSNAARNEPKYLYDESAVLPVIEALKSKPAGRKRAADGQQKKI